MKRHGRDNYYVVGEGILTSDDKTRAVCLRPSTEAALRKFRFSRLGPPGEGKALDDATLAALAGLMTAKDVAQPDSAAPAIPAGFTYLGQFVDHDLTFDNTTNVPFGQPVNVEDLLQGRSPALDLDSLYGRGPGDPADGKRYSDGARLRMGRTAATTFGMPNTNVDRDGFDLPRAGSAGGSKLSERRRALIPDHRNDENLAVAQTHLALMRFHNRVVDTLSKDGTPGADLFRAAQALVIKHYQWMLRTDFLPRIVDVEIVTDVFRNGRRFFEPAADLSGREKSSSSKYPLKYLQPGDTPTMPIEFSVAAYRLGHSMVRGGYQWNRVFRNGAASLMRLFTFSGTSGTLSPDGDPDLKDRETGTFERLPTNWIADFRRLFDLSPFNQPDLVVPAEEFNVAKRIDTLLVNPLDQLPPGAFGGGATAPIQANLAFRNLVRATMVQLATGQQMAEMFEIKALGASEILQGNGGVDLTGLPQAQKDRIVADTPLWFYILREAERNNGRLTGVGGRIVAEVFHRAMEGSRHSIVREPTWQPEFGRGKTFEMIDLLKFAFEGNVELLNPLG